MAVPPEEPSLGHTNSGASILDVYKGYFYRAVNGESVPDYNQNSLRAATKVSDWLQKYRFSASDRSINKRRKPKVKHGSQKIYRPRSV